jgi:hypothetical protein
VCDAKKALFRWKRDSILPAAAFRGGELRSVFASQSNRGAQGSSRRVPAPSGSAGGASRARGALRPLLNPHHRFWAHQKDPKLPSVPPGIVSGGPNSRIEDAYARKVGLAGCAPQTCYVDNIESWSTNEIAINWNPSNADLVALGRRRLGRVGQPVPGPRFAALSLDPRREPGAGNPHAGLCPGGGPKGPSLPGLSRARSSAGHSRRTCPRADPRSIRRCPRGSRTHTDRAAGAGPRSRRS